MNMVVLPVLADEGSGPVFASPWQAWRNACLNTPHGAPMTLSAAGEQDRQRG